MGALLPPVCAVASSVGRRYLSVFALSVDARPPKNRSARSVPRSADALADRAMRPATITYPHAEISSASRARCSTSRTAAPSDILGTYSASTWLAICGERPAVGSSRITSRGLREQDASHRQHLPLAPAELHASASSHVLQLWEGLHALLDAGVQLPARQQVSADHQVLLDRQGIEGVVNLRDVGHTSACERVRSASRN